MCHNAVWMGHPMRHELTCKSLLVKLANHYTTQGPHSIFYPFYNSVKRIYEEWDIPLIFIGRVYNSVCVCVSSLGF